MKNLIDDSVSYQVISKCMTSKTSREDLYSELYGSEQEIKSAMDVLTQQGIIDNVKVGEDDLFLLRKNIELEIFYNTWATMNLQRETLYNSISNEYGLPLEEVSKKLDKIVDIYVKSYLENYQNSTLRRMCLEDFIRALNIKTTFKDSSNLEKALLEELSKYEKPKKPYEFI